MRCLNFRDLLHRALGNSAAANDYTAAEEALAIHREHDAAMEKLYGKNA